MLQIPSICRTDVSLEGRAEGRLTEEFDVGCGALIDGEGFVPTAACGH